jgi:hypothetical protein
MVLLAELRAPTDPADAAGEIGHRLARFSPDLAVDSDGDGLAVHRRHAVASLRGHAIPQQRTASANAGIRPDAERRAISPVTELDSVMMITVLIYSVFTGLSGLAQEWGQLLVFQALAGVGIGGEWAADAAFGRRNLAGAEPATRPDRNADVAGGRIFPGRIAEPSARTCGLALGLCGWSSPGIGGALVPL